MPRGGNDAERALLGGGSGSNRPPPQKQPKWRSTGRGGNASGGGGSMHPSPSQFDPLDPLAGGDHHHPTLAAASVNLAHGDQSSPHGHNNNHADHAAPLMAYQAGPYDGEPSLGAAGVAKPCPFHGSLDPHGLRPERYVYGVGAGAMLGGDALHACTCAGGPDGGGSAFTPSSQMQERQRIIEEEHLASRRRRPRWVVAGVAAGVVLFVGLVFVLLYVLFLRGMRVRLDGVTAVSNNSQVLRFGIGVDLKNPNLEGMTVTTASFQVSFANAAGEVFEIGEVAGQETHDVSAGLSTRVIYPAFYTSKQLGRTQWERIYIELTVHRSELVWTVKGTVGTKAWFLNRSHYLEITGPEVGQQPAG